MNGLDPVVIGQGLAGVLVAVGTAFGVLRAALKQWQKAQEDERTAQAQRSEEATAAYRLVVKKEMRRFTIPLLRRLAHLEGSVETLLKVRTQGRKRGGGK